MCLLDCSIKNKKYKHLSEREKYIIEIRLKDGKRCREIAEELNRNIRTVQREKRRGEIKIRDYGYNEKIVYLADVSHKKYKENIKSKGPKIKLDKDYELANYIEKRIIEDKYSPEAVIGEIKVKKNKFKTNISVKTLYNYIYKNIFLELEERHLRIGKKKYNKKKQSKNWNKDVKFKSIEVRDDFIETREEFGHWEMDLVIGKQGTSAALLVLSERKTRKEIVRKIKSKHKKEVILALDKIEKEMGAKRFRKNFKTITVDNGMEFLDWKAMERSLISNKVDRTKIYYAHPYCSWERGTNENINKMIRVHIPKGIDIGKISEEKIKYIEEWINNYPRRIFKYKTANDIYNEQLTC